MLFVYVAHFGYFILFVFMCPVSPKYNSSFFGIDLEIASKAYLGPRQQHMMERRQRMMEHRQQAFRGQIGYFLTVFFGVLFLLVVVVVFSILRHS